MTVIVPERKSTGKLNLANPLTQGLVLAFNATTDVNAVTGGLSTGQTGTGITESYSASQGVRKSFSGTGTGKYQFATEAEGDKVTFVWVGRLPSPGTTNSRIVSSYNGAGLGRFDLYTSNVSTDGPVFQVLRSTTNGIWNPSSTTAFKGSDVIFSVTYDGSSTANVPVWYLNGNQYTGSVNTGATPSGALVTAGNQYAVGGRLDVTTRQLGGDLGLVLVYNRVLSAYEIKLLSQNPWQIFAPRRQLLYVSATSVTLTYLRPSADVSTGSWTPSTGTTLYGVLDEVVPDDADYIQASTATGCEISLSAGTTPPSRDNHTLKYRLLAGSGTIDVVLKCGTTTIKSWSHTLTGSLQDISQSLTNAEATNITDYSNLRVTFTSS